MEVELGRTYTRQAAWKYDRGELARHESYVAKICAHTARFDETELFLLDSLRRVVARA